MSTLKCASLLGCGGARPRILHYGGPLESTSARFLPPRHWRSGTSSNTPSPPSPSASLELRELVVQRVSCVITATSADKPRAGCIIMLRPSSGGGSCAGSGLSAWDVLCVSRKGNPADVGLPGGKANANEPTSLAAVRELYEETGYTLDPPSNYLLVPLLAADGDSGADLVSSCLAVTYLALGPHLAAQPPSPPAAGETGRVAWMPLDKALASSRSFAVYNTRIAAVLRAALPTLLRIAYADATVATKVDDSAAGELGTTIGTALGLPACGSAAAIGEVARRERKGAAK